MVSKGYWDPEKATYSNIDIYAQKDLFVVDKQHLDINKFRNELSLLKSFKKYNDLFLNTTICVFGNEVLKDEDCSLTLPLKVCSLDKDQTGTFQFWYEQGKIPEIRCQISGSDHIYEAIGSKYDYRNK